ncbi:MAG: amino acid ABC transporter permease [Aerococcus sp.]|nr:amino acid ABC transporter permease [Aerococcus sp.]
MAGITVTIPLALLSFIFGMIFAIVTALARISKSKLLNGIFYVYVWLFRGTPLLVQLFIVYFGLPKIGIQFNTWTAAILTFSLNTGAYASETIRSAILSIPKGQWEAAQSLGMTRTQVLKRIIGPQAFRVSLPPLFNSFIGLVKDTSLASNVTMVEMFMVSQRIAARTYEPLLLYVLVALVYLVMCTLLNIIQDKMETRLQRYSI